MHTVSITNGSLLAFLYIFDSMKMPYFVCDGDVSFVASSDAAHLFINEELPDIS